MLSLRELAARVHYGKTYLSDLEHGRRHPNDDVVARLDDALGAGGDLVAVSRAHEAHPATALHVAVAVVVGDSGVLLVQRRTPYRELNWQFPAGVVKPGETAATVAVNESAAETGVYARVHSELGRRVHPITGALCDYFLCEHLSGQARNLDPVENAAALWVPVVDVTRYIPAAQLYPPVHAALEESHDR